MHSDIGWGQVYNLGGFRHFDSQRGFLLIKTRLVGHDLNTYLVWLNDKFDIIGLFLLYIKITTEHGVASLQLPVKYPQLPANLIG